MVDQGRSRKREVHVHGTGNPKKSQSREDMRAYKLRDFYLGVSADEVSKESAMLQRWIKELQNANPALGRTPTLIGYRGRVRTSDVRLLLHLRRCRQRLCNIIAKASTSSSRSSLLNLPAEVLDQLFPSLAILRKDQTGTKS